MNEFDYNSNIISISNDNKLYQTYQPNVIKFLENYTQNIYAGEKANFFKVALSFVNIIKNKILNRGETKFHLKEFYSTDKNPTLGMIFDMDMIENFLEKNNIIIETDIKTNLRNYFTLFDLLPLYFNFNEKEIIYQNKKQNFFKQGKSKLIFVTFVLEGKYKYYYEDPDEDLRDDYVKVEDVVDNSSKYLIAHYIYKNYYFLSKTNTENLKIKNVYQINPELDVNNKKENKNIFTEITNNNIQPISQKISLERIVGIVNLSKKYLSIFSNEKK